MRNCVWMSLLGLAMACNGKSDDSGTADGTADDTAATADDSGAADGSDGTDGGGTGDGGGGDDTGGGGTGGDTGITGIEIAGSWLDNYGGDHVITDDAWVSFGGSSTVHLTFHDNDMNYTVGQNDAANTYNPELWSRFDWTVDASGQLWVCQAAYDAADEAAALSAPPADPLDPATTGCGGFPWSSLSPL